MQAVPGTRIAVHRHAHRLQARSHRPRHLAGRPRSSYTMPLTRRMWQLWPASFAGCAFRRAPTAPVSGLGPWQRVQRTGTSARSFATMPDSQGPVPIPWRPVRSEAGQRSPPRACASLLAVKGVPRSSSSEKACA